MSDLSAIEKRKLERLFQMGGGYVLDFSNNTLDEFFIETIARSLYDSKYNYGSSSSKANQMRGFWTEESNPVVAKLLSHLIDYAESEHHSNDVQLIADCRKIVSRLRTSHPVAELDAIATIGREHDLDVVAQAVSDLIEKNDLVAGLDRLHTFATGYLRSLCEGRGLATERGKPLHSLFGEYVRSLREAGHLESRMTVAILKGMNAPLDAFNDVRNNQSLAHDNTLLNHDEAMLIFNHVTSSLRFLRDLDKRMKRREKATAAKASQKATLDDDIPF
jgi:hypothetical protein